MLFRSDECQRIGNVGKRQEMPVNYSLAVEPFDVWGFDYMGPFPSSNGYTVTPGIRCAKCLPVIRRCCHVICLRVAFCHVIMCISFCIRVRFLHPSLFPVVRFAIRHSYALRRPPFVSRRERVLNFLGMAQVCQAALV